MAINSVNAQSVTPGAGGQMNQLQQALQDPMVRQALMALIQKMLGLDQQQGGGQQPGSSGGGKTQSAGSPSGGPQQAQQCQSDPTQDAQRVMQALAQMSPKQLEQFLGQLKQQNPEAFQKLMQAIQPASASTGAGDTVA